MEILGSIAVGAVFGGLATLACRSKSFSMSTSMAVGILGGLLGLAADFWLGTGALRHLAFSATLASSVGAALTLFLWIVAQRLFFGSPQEAAVSD